MQTSISSTQSREARRELGLSQADVASAIGVNRAYLSDFENGHPTRLTKAQTKRLRDFYESKVDEARANGEDVEIDLAGEAISVDVPEIRSYTDDGLMFRASEAVSKAVLAATKEAIRANDQQLVELLNTSFARDDGFFGGGEPTADTQQAISEAYALLAANYLLLRSVTGWPEIGLTADSISLAGDTIAAGMIEQARESFVSAGLISDSTTEGGEE